MVLHLTRLKRRWYNYITSNVIGFSLGVVSIVWELSGIWLVNYDFHFDLSKSRAWFILRKKDFLFLQVDRKHKKTTPLHDILLVVLNCKIANYKANPMVILVWYRKLIWFKEATNLGWNMASASRNSNLRQRSPYSMRYLWCFYCILEISYFLAWSGSHFNVKL